MNNKDFIELQNKHSLTDDTDLKRVFHKGEGVFLFDVEGKKYFDLTVHTNFAIFGHSPNRLLAVIQEQAKNLSINTNVYCTDRLGPFLKKLAELTKFSRVSAFSCAQQAYSEVIRYARYWAKKKKGLDFNCQVWFVSNRYKNFSCYQDIFHDCCFFTVEEFLNITSKTHPSVALLLIDPFCAEHDTLLLSKEEIGSIRLIADRLGALFVIDEISLPFGYFGYNFAFQHYVLDDIDGVLIGEYLGAGMAPICAAVFKQDIYEEAGSYDPTLAPIYPIAAAVALEGLCILEELFLAERGLMKSRDLKIQLSGHHMVHSVQGQGLYLKVQLYQGLNSRQLISAFDAVGIFIGEKLSDLEIIIAIPLLASEQEIEQLAYNFIKVLDQADINMKMDECHET